MDDNIKWALLADRISLTREEVLACATEICSRSTVNLIDTFLDFAQSLRETENVAMVFAEQYSAWKGSSNNE